MKFYAPRLYAALSALLIGVLAVWLLSFKPRENNPLPTVEQSSLPLKQVPPPSESPIENVSPPQIEKTTKQKRVPIKQYVSFEGVILRLKKLAEFMDAKGEQTFYISDVENNDGEFAHVYWKQKNAIIVLQLPVFDEPTNAELYWLSGKAYTDLNKDVVPKELGNMGCCLVTKAWADKTVKACKAGYKLKFNIKAQAK